jgi:hypothetical protein
MLNLCLIAPLLVMFFQLKNHASQVFAFVDLVKN